MPVYYPQLILLIPLAALAAGDLRTRTVSLVWLIVLSGLSVAVAWNMNGLWQTVVNVASNMFMLFYLSIGVIIYIRIKVGAWINPLKEYIGSGDLIFLAALTPLFELREYVTFLICVSLFSLAWMLVARAVCRSVRTIPFAATMGIALGVTIIVKTLI